MKRALFLLAPIACLLHAEIPSVPGIPPGTIKTTTWPLADLPSWPHILTERGFAEAMVTYSGDKDQILNDYRNRIKNFNQRAIEDLDLMRPGSMHSSWLDNKLEPSSRQGRVRDQDSRDEVRAHIYYNMCGYRISQFVQMDLLRNQSWYVNLPDGNKFKELLSYGEKYYKKYGQSPFPQQGQSLVEPIEEYEKLPSDDPRKFIIFGLLWELSKERYSRIPQEIIQYIKTIEINQSEYEKIDLKYNAPSQKWLETTKKVVRGKELPYWFLRMSLVDYNKFHSYCNYLGFAGSVHGGSEFESTDGYKKELENYFKNRDLKLLAKIEKYYIFRDIYSNYWDYIDELCFSAMRISVFESQATKNKTKYNKMAESQRLLNIRSDKDKIANMKLFYIKYPPGTIWKSFLKNRLSGMCATRPELKGRAISALGNLYN